MQFTLLLLFDVSGYESTKMNVRHVQSSKYYLCILLMLLYINTENPCLEYCCIFQVCDGKKMNYFNA